MAEQNYPDQRKKAAQEAAEYQANAPVKRVDSHQRGGFSIINPEDSLQNRTSITDSEGNTQTYGVGDYVEGLGMIEDIDERGNPTILPDDPEQPAYRLGQSEQGPEGRYKESDHVKAAREGLYDYDFDKINSVWGDIAQRDIIRDRGEAATTHARLQDWAKAALQADAEWGDRGDSAEIDDMVEESGGYANEEDLEASIAKQRAALVAKMEPREPYPYLEYEEEEE